MLHALHARKAGEKDNTWARRLTGRLLCPDGVDVIQRLIHVQGKNGGQGGIVESVLRMAVFCGFECADICHYMTGLDAIYNWRTPWRGY